MSDPVAEAALRAAIDLKLLVSAAYNKGRSVLAPHSLEERHGELYLKAVTIERDGRKPTQVKLGTFKMSGLTEVSLTRDMFPSEAIFAAAADTAAAAAKR